MLFIERTFTKMKKLLTLLLFVVLTTVAVKAQTPKPCATIETPEERIALMKLKPLLEQYQKSDEILYIPIQFHNVADNDGTGRWSKFNIIQNIADVNEDYAEYNMQFFLYETDVNDVDNAAMYDHDNFGVDNQMNQNKTANVVNVFIVEDPAGACGYYTYGADCIMVGKNCAGIGSTTLTHELGHYFGLPHPFSGWEYGTPNNNQIERVPRTGSSANCEFAGDSFCGTGPDYVSDRWDCPYSQLTDPLGNTFRPDSSFYMSYSSDQCQSRHAFDQVASMKAQIGSIRTYLTNHNTSEAENTDEIGNMYLVYPANEATVPTTVTIEWEPVDGATHYALYIRDVTEEIAMVDEIITGTSYTLNNLAHESRIFWQVRPFHQGNYSATPPQERRFNVSEDQIITVDNYDVSHPSCANAFDASISFEATGGNPPYNYNWTNGVEGNALADIPYGKYSCVVTDADGVENTLDFFIDQPTPLQADALVGFNATTALVAGGTAPYEYAWSTSDETTKTANNLQAGLNTLTITDANGCETTHEFMFIVPNVVANNITCYGDENGSLFVFGADGGEGNYSYEWGNGSNELIRENLSAGEYFLTVTDSEGNSTVGSYIISEADAPLALNITQNGNDIIVLSNGGVEPINFVWSDGSIENIRINLPSGNYTLIVSDANGCTITETFSVTTTSNETLNTKLIKAYFNSQGNLIVDSNFENENVEINLFNIQGKAIMQDNFVQSNGNKIYDLANLSNGIYLLQVNVNGVIQTIKLVK